MGLLKIADPEAMATIESHEERIVRNSIRLTALEGHKKLCDELHSISQTHRIRSDAAMENLAQSNVILAKSIDSMNTTISEIVRDDRPVVKRSREFHGWIDKVLSWFGISRFIAKIIFGSILTLAALVAAIKSLGLF